MSPLTIKNHLLVKALSSIIRSRGGHLDTISLTSWKRAWSEL